MHSTLSIDDPNKQWSTHKQRFFQKSRILKNLDLSIKIQDNMRYQESVIKRHFNSKYTCLPCQKENTYSVQPEFRRAYQKLAINEKIDYYCLIVEFLRNSNEYINEEIHDYLNSMNEQLVKNIKFGAEIETGAIFKGWKCCEIELLTEEALLVITLNKTAQEYQLSSYFLHQIPGQYILTFISYVHDVSPVKIRIHDESLFTSFYNQITLVINKAICQNFFLSIIDYRKFLIVPYEEERNSRRLLESPNISRISSIKRFGETSSLDDSPFMLRLHSGNQTKQQERPQIEELSESLERTEKAEVCEDEILHTLNMMDEDYDSIKQQITNGVINGYLDEIQRIGETDQYSKVMEYRNCYLLQNKFQPKLFKYIFQLSSSLDRVTLCLLDIARISKWNKCVSQSAIKVRISSENTLVIHQKHSPTSKFSRGRDFLISRHVFKTNNCYYFIDRSIEHFASPSTLLLLRTQIDYAIWRLEKRDNGTHVVLEIKFRREAPSITHLKRYFQGYYGIQEYLLTQPTNFTEVYVSLNWEIKLNLLRDNSVSSVEQERFYSMGDVHDESEYHSTKDAGLEDGEEGQDGSDN